MTTVAQILREKGGNVISVGANETVAEATRLLAEHRIGAVLVMEPDGAIDGVLSERDIVRALADNGADLLAKPVSALMTRKVFGCKPTDSISTIMTLMTERRIRHLPVMDGRELLGLISIGDVVKHRIAETEHEAEALKEYIVSG